MSNPIPEPVPLAASAERQAEIADFGAIQEFIDEGLVDGPPVVIKHGKEATVYRVRATAELECRFAAVKVYHDAQFRNFNNARVYEDDRLILNQRTRRAVSNRSDFGRGAQSAMWVGYEYETLSTLFDAGAGVPEPYACTERAILMSYLGDGSEPASQLARTRLSADEAPILFREILGNIELFLANHIVHADLSAYNVLYWRGRVTIIDFPQALDPRTAKPARRLLERDIANIASHFRKYGVEFDAAAHAADLWTRFELGLLG
jgi:RIO kinase 1